MADLLTIEGNYRFHARARYWYGCEATRELLWSVHVEGVVAPERTEIVTESLDTLADGREKLRVTLTP